MKANLDIRNELNNRGFYAWQLAEALGIRESSLSRKLRHELSPDEKDSIFRTIERMEVQYEHDAVFEN